MHLDAIVIASACITSHLWIYSDRLTNLASAYLHFNSLSVLESHDCMFILRHILYNALHFMESRWFPHLTCLLSSFSPTVDLCSPVSRWLISSHFVLQKGTSLSTGCFSLLYAYLSPILHTSLGLLIEKFMCNLPRPIGGRYWAFNGKSSGCGIEEIWCNRLKYSSKHLRYLAVLCGLSILLWHSCHFTVLHVDLSQFLHSSSKSHHQLRLKMQRLVSPLPYQWAILYMLL